MLVKLSADNQVTLPQEIVEQFAGVQEFVVAVENERIVLTPLRSERMEAIWEKLRQSGITEQDVDDAVRWARSHPA